MTCRCGCGGPVLAKDCAEPCYHRWRRAGFPASGPPPPVTHEERTARSTATLRERAAERVAERRECYAMARAIGLSVEQAAADTGISVRTAREKYEPAYRRRLRAAA